MQLFLCVEKGFDYFSIYIDVYDKKAFYAGAATMDWLEVLAMAVSMAKGLSGAGSRGGGGYGGRLVTPDGMTIGAPAIAGEGVLAQCRQFNLL